MIIITGLSPLSQKGEKITHLKTLNHTTSLLVFLQISFIMLIIFDLDNAAVSHIHVVPHNFTP